MPRGHSGRGRAHAPFTPPPPPAAGGATPRGALGGNAAPLRAPPPCWRLPTGTPRLRSAAPGLRAAGRPPPPMAAADPRVLAVAARVAESRERDVPALLLALKGNGAAAAEGWQRGGPLAASAGSRGPCWRGRELGHGSPRPSCPSPRSRRSWKWPGQVRACAKSGCNYKGAVRAAAVVVFSSLGNSHRWAVSQITPVLLPSV